MLREYQAMQRAIKAAGGSAFVDVARQYAEREEEWRRTLDRVGGSTLIDVARQYAEWEEEWRRTLDRVGGSTLIDVARQYAEREQEWKQALVAATGSTFVEAMRVTKDHEAQLAELRQTAQGPYLRGIDVAVEKLSRDEDFTASADQFIDRRPELAEKVGGIAEGKVGDADDSGETTLAGVASELLADDEVKAAVEHALSDADYQSAMTDLSNDPRLLSIVKDLLDNEDFRRLAGEAFESSASDTDGMTREERSVARMMFLTLVAMHVITLLTLTAPLLGIVGTISVLGSLASISGFSVRDIKNRKDE